MDRGEGERVQGHIFSFIFGHYAFAMPGRASSFILYNYFCCSTLGDAGLTSRIFAYALFCYLLQCTNE